MKQSFYLILGLVAVFLFGAWGHSLYTRHFDAPAKTDETLWGDPSEIEEAYALQRNLHATVTSLALEMPSSGAVSPVKSAWLISESRLDSLVETLDAYIYGNQDYNEPSYQVVLARYPSGRPKFISVLRFFSHANDHIRGICGVEKSPSSNLLVFCPDYNEKVGINILLRYDSPDGKYSAAKYPSEIAWRCNMTNDPVHEGIRVSKPEYCEFNLGLRLFY